MADDRATPEWQSVGPPGAGGNPPFGVGSVPPPPPAAFHPPPVGPTVPPAAAAPPAYPPPYQAAQSYGAYQAPNDGANPQAATFRRDAGRYFLGAMAVCAAFVILGLVTGSGGHSLIWFGGLFVAVRLLLSAKRRYAASRQLGAGPLTGLEKGLGAAAIAAVVVLGGLYGAQFLKPATPVITPASASDQCYHSAPNNLLEVVSCDDSTANYRRGAEVTDPNKECPANSNSYVKADTGDYFCLMPK